MKNSWIALLAVIVSAPALAQDEPAPADTPPPADAAPATPPADQPPADTSAAPADSSAPPADTGTPPADSNAAAPAETPPAQETASSETPPAEETPKEPWKLYGGVDYVRTQVSSTGAGTLGINDYHSKFLRARFGRRVLEAVGLEVQYGVDLSDYDKGEVSTDRYYGVYVVPTATVFEVLELSTPVGYARNEMNIGKLNAHLASVAYGFNAELPLKAFGDDLPDFRFTAGWMIYHQSSQARVYGFNAGARYDFETQGFGNPFSGIGHWYKTHMPGWLGGGSSSDSGSSGSSGGS